MIEFEKECVQLELCPVQIYSKLAKSVGLCIVAIKCVFSAKRLFFGLWFLCEIKISMQSIRLSYHLPSTFFMYLCFHLFFPHKCVLFLPAIFWVQTPPYIEMYYILKKI